MSCDGAGATIAFATTTTLDTLETSTIEGLQRQRQAVEKNILAKGNTTYCPGGKVAINPITVEAFYKHADYVNLNNNFEAKVVETVTITQSDGGITAGTAFISSVTGPAAVDNDPQMMSYQLQFDGETLTISSPGP